MKPDMAHGRPDDFQTPVKALFPLKPYLHKSWRIWEPACGKLNLVSGFRSMGFDCIGTDIIYGDEQDFLKIQPDFEWDCIVTNPPYSLKDKFLERAYWWGKPFALLLPLTALEAESRQRLYDKYGVSLILMPRRINFETPSGVGSGSWFASAWFTYGLELPSQLLFTGLEKTK